MRQKWFLVFVMLMLSCLIVSCNGETNNSQGKEKPVKVQKVVEENRDIILKYTGVIAPNEIRKIGFKSSGKIGKINVHTGEQVKKGQVLANLDTTDLVYALRASEATLASIEAQYKKAVNGALPSDVANADLNVEKAQAAYIFAKDTYDKMKILYDEGGMAETDLDQVKLELDLRKAELSQAQEISNQLREPIREEDKGILLNQVKAAQVDVEQKKSLIADASLTACIDGYVVDITSEEGEMINAGYPVVVLRDEGIIVSVGIVEKELDQLSLGMTADIMVGERKTAGKIVSLAQVPDDRTRTYNAEIALEKDVYSIGSIVNVEIKIGEKKGIWIPITAILSNGQDYVYLIKDGIVEETDIAIEGVDGAFAQVTGLSGDDLLVVEGTLRVRDGDPVAIQ